MWRTRDAYGEEPNSARERIIDLPTDLLPSPSYSYPCSQDSMQSVVNAASVAHSGIVRLPVCSFSASSSSRTSLAYVFFPPAVSRVLPTMPFKVSPSTGLLHLTICSHSSSRRYSAGSDNSWTLSMRTRPTQRVTSTQRTSSVRSINRCSSPPTDMRPAARSCSVTTSRQTCISVSSSTGTGRGSRVGSRVGSMGSVRAPS